MSGIQRVLDKIPDNEAVRAWKKFRESDTATEALRLVAIGEPELALFMAFVDGLLGGVDAVRIEQINEANSQ